MNKKHSMILTITAVAVLGATLLGGTFTQSQIGTQSIDMSKMDADILRQIQEMGGLQLVMPQAFSETDCGALESTGRNVVRFDLTGESVMLPIMGHTADKPKEYYGMSFNQQVPGPTLRVQQGDVVMMTLTIPADEVTGHGNDMHSSQTSALNFDSVNPGEVSEYCYIAETAGVFKYHCSGVHLIGMDQHVLSGMYGIAIVDPADGYKKLMVEKTTPAGEIDRMFYDSDALEFQLQYNQLYLTEDGKYDGAAMFDHHNTGTVVNGFQFGYVPNSGHNELIKGNPNSNIFVAQPWNAADLEQYQSQLLFVETGQPVRFFIENQGNEPVYWHVVGEIIDRVTQGNRVQSAATETWMLGGTSSSSPPAPNYSPLPESPPHLDLTATAPSHDENTAPEIGEACEETFIFTSAPTSIEESKSNTSNEHEDSLEVPSECNTETELLGSSSNYSDSDITFTPTSMNANNASPDQEGTFFLQPDVIAKLQAPLAPLKRRSESNISETSMAESLPLTKRKRIALTSEKRPNILVMSKNAPKLSTNVTVIDRDSLYMPKSSRVASNVVQSNTIPSTKPSLPLTMDSKVPVKMRQKFLDKVFSEYVKVLPENDAHSKAKDDEKKIYDRTTNKQTYTGICLNALKKIRVKVEKALGNSKSNGLDESKSVGKKSTANLDLESDTPDSTTSAICNYISANLKDSFTCLDAVSTSTTPKSPISDDTELIKTLKSIDSVEKSLNKSDICSRSGNNDFYNLLEKYLLTEEQLIENAYPMKTSMQGVAEIKVTPSSTEPHDINPNAKRHCCARCGKNFIIMNNGSYMRAEECWYHHGKAFNQKVGGEWIAVFSCCQSSSFNGCQVADKHVTNGENPAKRTGFTVLQQPPDGKENSIFALDCEMVYTSIGLELARVSVIDHNHKTVYDSFVKPYNQVVDYNTRFSGITQQKLTGTLPNLKQVQRFLKQILFQDSILIGHSLESDLKALKIIHNKVIDTAIVFPHRKGGVYKRALSTLTREYLEKIIQDDEGGHDSTEDAIACIELMELQISQDRNRLKKEKKQ